MSEIERVERLVASLVSFASPPRAEFRMGLLDETVQDVAMLLTSACQRQKVELKLDCKRLPPFLFDQDKIRQAVLNLLKNAQEALPDGGVITLKLTSESGYAVLRVADSGPGIAEADLPLLFEPFFTRKGAGTGLGLSITRRIAEEHGGSVSAENQPEQGACFTIRLPMTRDNRR